MSEIIVIYLVLYSFVFLFGLCIGSFLNVCIYRIPLGISTARGRSFCPGCGHPLGAFDLFPMLSYLFLRGRCRYCRQKISLRYPFVELLTGLLFLAAFYIYGFSPYSVVLSLFFSVLIVTAFIDLDHRIIPDRLSVVILILVPFACYFDPSGFSLVSHIAGLIIISVPMLLLAFAVGGFGGGDVKLMAAAGLFLGMQNTVVAAVFAILSGAVYGVILLLRKKAGPKTEIPFGPFLAAGLIAASCLGDYLVNWYLSFF